MSDPTAETHATARDVLTDGLLDYPPLAAIVHEGVAKIVVDRGLVQHLTERLAAAGCLAPAAPPTDDPLREAAARALVVAGGEDPEEPWTYDGDLSAPRWFYELPLVDAVLDSPRMVALRERAAALDRVLALLDGVDLQDGQDGTPAGRARLTTGEVRAVLAARSAAPTEGAHRG